MIGSGWTMGKKPAYQRELAPKHYSLPAVSLTSLPTLSLPCTLVPRLQIGCGREKFDAAWAIFDAEKF